MWWIDIATDLPERIVSAKETANWIEGDEAFISEKIGIKSRHLLSPDENPLDMAKRAAEKALAKSGLKADELDWLVFVTQNPDFKLPQSSSLLCDAIQAKESIASFDISLACSGYVYALSIATAFAAANGLGPGMIITCDPYSRSMRRSEKSVVAVFGDAATATVLRPGGPFKIGIGEFGTDGSGGMGLSVLDGGSRHPNISIDAEEMSLDPERSGITMDGRAILDFMQKRVPSAVSNCLAKNGISELDVDKFVFHQASDYMLKLLTRRMKLPEDKVPIELSDVGNTVSSSIPIVLERLIDRNELGDKIMVCGFGVGLSWAANVISRDN